MHDPQPRWSPARLAYGFYAVAATGAVIGQTWVALTHAPWGTGVPAWARVAAVLPFALCLELLAMALAAMADERMRLGERVFGFRVFSALIATVAVGILVIGHWPHYYWSASFGLLSSSAYLLWLLHSAARRRDALRAAGKLADTAPDYGLWRRLRHPIWTARAAEAAREGSIDQTTGTWRPLGLYESLRAAQLTIRAEKRRPALAKAVEQVVRADHHDPKMADIAVHTLDLDRIATELETQVDYTAWANRLAPAITASALASQPGRRSARATGARSMVGRPVTRRRRRHRTHVAIRQVRSDADPVNILPTAQPERPAALMLTPTGGRGRTEHLISDRPVTSTVDAPSTPTPGNHHNLTVTGGTGGADSDPGAPVTPDLIDTAPVTTGIQTAALSQTAAAVAYWRDQHPQLRPGEIAARVGKSERQVRRILAALHSVQASRPNGAPVPHRVDAER